MPTTTTKRIPHLGALIGASLTLTQERTRACGLLLPDGDDGGEQCRRAYAEMVASVRREADRLGRQIEVHASPRTGPGWVVMHVEPRLSASAEVTA